MSPVINERLVEIAALPLKAGAHTITEHQMCVMEAVAYVAGEAWTDSPQCACPVVASFMRSWNDCLPTDEDRESLLKPFVADLVGSKSSAAVEKRRSYMALDWLIRVHTPKWLDLQPELASHALALRDLEEIADLADATAAGVKVCAARAAARAAAGDAAGAAAWAAAGAAAGAAAWAAAWDAAGASARAAAGDAAGAAAWAAAGDAAWDADGDAAGDAAWDAAYNKMLAKIIRNGVRILSEKGKA